MANASNNIALRIHADGSAVIVGDLKAIEAAGVAAGEATARAAQKASGAIQAQSQEARELQKIQHDSAYLRDSQADFARMLGVNEPTKSARSSAAVYEAAFRETELEALAVRRLREELDPLTAATDRYAMQKAELIAWERKGLISSTELATAQARLKANYDANTLAIQRNTAGLTRNQMASRLNLSRQGADVLVTAAMGMNPAMIAIQQGPQILDALATSGIKARAALFLLGGAFGTMAAAAAVSAYAVWDAEQQNLALERAVTGLGRTSGLTADQLDDLARAGADQGEVSIKSARQQAAAYVTTGRIAGEIIPDLIALGKDYASVFGMDAEQATQALAEAMKEPDKAARELTRTLSIFDQATLDNIDSLIEQGDHLAAQKILLEGMKGALEGHADSVDDMTTAWQALGRWISDTVTRFGEWLYVTDTERLADLDRDIARIEQSSPQARAFDRGLDRDTGAQGLSRLKAERDALAAEISARDRPFDPANRDAQLEKDRQDRNRSRAGGSNRSAEREAEREAREQEQRRRRAEDRELELQMIEAQAAADQARIRALERQQDITARSRELIDDGVNENKAYMTALSEQARIDVARAVEADRAFDAIQRTHAIEVARISGNTELVRLFEEQEWLQRRILEYGNAEMDLDRAKSLALADQLELTEARALAMQKAADQSARERAYHLAVLRGDSPNIDRLDTDLRIRDRAEDLRRDDENLTESEAMRRARREITEELAAETEGAFKAGMADFVRDIRRSGLNDALARQFDNAADRFIEKLIDGLSELDWARLLGQSGGGSGGGWLEALFSIFPGGGIGGGLPGAGQGFLDNLGGGFAAPVMAPQLPTLSAKDVAQRTAAITGGKASQPPVTVVFAPVLNAQGAGPREVDALSRRLDQMQAELPVVIPGLINEAISRRQSG
mgnify:CR=1 FL=1